MAMTKKKTNAGLFIALCTLVYFTSYITRKVYASTMIEIIRDLAFSNEDAGLVNTALFITYGAGQIISGVLGDRIAPHKRLDPELMPPHAAHRSAACLFILMRPRRKNA